MLRLYKFKIGATSISLADNVGMARYLGYEDILLPSEFVNILYTYEGYYCLDTSFDYNTGKLLVFPCCKKSDISVNGTTKYVEIDLKNNNATSIFTFTNNTAGTIKYGGSESELTLFVCKDYIVAFAVSDNETKMYVENRSDNTQVRTVKYSNGNDLSFPTTSTIYFSPVFVHDNILLIRYKINSSDNYFYLLDMSTGVIKKTNAKNMSVAYYHNNIEVE